MVTKSLLLCLLILLTNSEGIETSISPREVLLKTPNIVREKKIFICAHT